MPGRITRGDKVRDVIEVDVPRSARHERSNPLQLGKVLAAGTIVASSTLAGVQATSPARVPVEAAPVSLASTVYTLRGGIPWPIDTTLSGAVCDEASGNTCSDITYPYLWGDMSVRWGAQALTDTLQHVTTPTTIFGYSLGAAAATEWLAENAHNRDAPSPNDLHFILTGNAKRKYGGSWWLYPSTPTTPSTQYTVLDIAREYDGAADTPNDMWNILAWANQLAGFWLVHTNYNSVDLVNDEKLVWQEGNTTYVLVRTPDLPLLMPILEPLRWIGLGFVADIINAPFKAIVDWAYARNYPNIITDPVKAQKAVDDALHGVSAATSTTAKSLDDLTAAAAVTAASLVSDQATKGAPELADTKDQAPTETVELPVHAAKVLAVEDGTPDASVETPQSTDPSTEAPKPETEPTADTASDEADLDQAASTEASDQGDDGYVGRHRVPKTGDATGTADGADGTGTADAAPKASTGDTGAQHAKSSASSDSASD